MSFLGISPWWLMILFGYPVCYTFWFFYGKALPHTYRKLEFDDVQRIILLFSTFTLFVLAGTVGYRGYGSASHLMALLSLFAVPIVLAACWPLRGWVRVG